MSVRLDFWHVSQLPDCHSGVGLVLSHKMPKFVSNSYAHVISFTASMKAQHNFCYRHCNCGLELGTCFFKKLVLIQVLAVFWMWISTNWGCVSNPSQKRLVGPVCWCLERRFQALWCLGDIIASYWQHLCGEKRSHKSTNHKKKIRNIGIEVSSKC